MVCFALLSRPLCPSDISPAERGKPDRSAPGIPREIRFALSRPFRFAKGALAAAPLLWIPAFAGMTEGAGMMVVLIGRCFYCGGVAVVGGGWVGGDLGGSAGVGYVGLDYLEGG